MPRPTSEARVLHACVKGGSLFLVPICEAVGRVKEDGAQGGPGLRSTGLAQSRSQGCAGSRLGLQSPVWARPPIPLPVLTGVGSGMTLLSEGAAGLNCHYKAAQRGQAPGQSLTASPGHPWGEARGQPYLVHQQLGIGLDWYTDHVGAIDGLPVRGEKAKPSDRGGCGSRALQGWESSLFYSWGNRGPEKTGDWKKATPGGPDRGPQLAGHLWSSDAHLTVWSWRQRPEREWWMSSQVRPWSSRLGQVERGTCTGR